MSSKTYRFTVHDGPASTPRVDFEAFGNAAEARAHAELLLADGPRFRAVTVTDGYDDAFAVEQTMSPDDCQERAALAHGEANAAPDDALREQWRSVARSWERLAELSRRR